MSKSRLTSAALQTRKAAFLDVRARKNTARKRCRARVFSAIGRFSIVGASLIGTWFGTNKLLTKFFYTNPDYNIQHVSLPSKSILSQEDFLTATDLRFGTNIFTVDLEQARKAVLALPQIRAVTIERLLPDTLRVHVEEKKPVAWLISNPNGKDIYGAADSYLLEQQGDFYKPTHLLTDYFSLPIIYGLDRELLANGDPLVLEDLQRALQLLVLIAERKNPQISLRTLDISNGYCIKARGPNNETIIFAPENFEEQIDRLQELMNFCKQSGKQIESVNLFVHRNTPVRFSMVSGENTPPHVGHGESIH